MAGASIHMKVDAMVGMKVGANAAERHDACGPPLTARRHYRLSLCLSYTALNDVGQQ